MQQVHPIELADGSHTAITIFRDGASASAPLLLLFPAMGVEASYYQPFAEHLAQRDWIVVTADLRGLGQSSVRPRRGVDFGYETMLELDYRGIFAAIERQFSQRPLYVMGHSLGGQLASLYLSRHRMAVAGLILIASCSVHYSGWTGWERWRLRLGFLLFPLLAGAWGYFPGDLVGFGGRAGRRQILDWCQQGRSGQYHLAGSTFDYERALGTLILPVLAIAIEDDPLAPIPAIQNLYRKLHPDGSVQQKVLTRALAQSPRLNHFNWARRGAATAQLIREWQMGLAPNPPGEPSV
ncbi:MAG: alpha/beta fold hydrolase [Bacteroidota bacterium]